MKKTNVLIIGAGAAGLMAAYHLSKAGSTVTVLEARNHTGGRIHTLSNELFFQQAELGAEFIHGNLPVTLALLNEAGIAYASAGGEMWQYKDGAFAHADQMIEDWDALLGKMNELGQDIPLADFLKEHFSGDKFFELRKSVNRYVSGYDTADPANASTFALRNEWQHEDEGAQHRLTTGYCTLIKYLTYTCKAAGNEIILNAIVKEISWEPGEVKVVTVDDIHYEAEKVIVALPLGVLQADKTEIGAVNFNPAIPEHLNAVNRSGFGAIIKVLLEFDDPFWENASDGNLKDMAFLFTEEAIPTWWTQAPQHSPLLTGWLGGNAARHKEHLSNEEMLKLSLTSLSNVFQISPETLKEKLIAWNIANWTADPFTRGSYAYDTVDSPAARKLLREPVENTIYFAGEYLYEGTAMGTVEAALTSGKEVADKMIRI